MIDDVIAVGLPFPRMKSVSALAGYRVLVRWTGDDRPVVVDLGPSIVAMKHYAPLRDDRALFETVHVTNPSTIAWGADDTIDMHVSEVERLVASTLDAADFKA